MGPNNSDNANTVKEVVYDKKIEGFLCMMEAASIAIDCASKFETDLINLVNPSASLVYKMFAFPLAPFCETSHEEMKMTFTQMIQSWQMIDVDDDSRE